MTHNQASIPVWSVIAPILGMVFLALVMLGVLPQGGAPVLIAAGVLLGAAVFAAVHHAEVLALALGEPFGSILLALAVTVIEVALIVSIMLSGAAGAEEVARDTVFSAVMIVLNGVVGLCLVCGGQRHLEQSFQLQGVSAALSVLGILAALALILPNFTITAEGPVYSRAQLIATGVLSLGLWATFVFVQTIRHRDYFLDVVPEDHLPAVIDQAEAAPVPRMIVAGSVAMLLVALIAVVLLAKKLSGPLDAAIMAAGMPKALVGVVIATVVLLPESLAAVRSAVRNHLQNSLNLALGSAIASIGLTIPAVTVVSLIIDTRVVLGVSAANMTLLALTLFVSVLTLGTGRTTVLQGACHLVIFAVFLLLAAEP